MFEVCIWISRWLADLLQPLHELSVLQVPWSYGLINLSREALASELG